ncbi:hypothetical protein GOP47_0009282 [Adiantum capillus-veneris]|uniref:Protein kinase domain-containing protein n=1 Tax=Adiantum capillus-veneris TaxID=13818 RepID=A0A9D4ZJD5_ADICA|nr:hypothetical protein GOP47_0009282 [Adiantum capillus-veneris]
MAVDLLSSEEEARPSKRRRCEDAASCAGCTHSPEPHDFKEVPPVTDTQDPQKKCLDFKCAARPANKAVKKWRKDDEDGHFKFNLGESLTPRYKIVRKMGQGTFGQVLECWDRDAHEAVAIKVLRSSKLYQEAAMTEIDVLFQIGKNEIGARVCVQFRRWFKYQNHICIVFEKLGPSLYDFLKANDFHPFTVNTARRICRQILESVEYMHSLKYIHTDLKPENVLLISSEYTEALDSKLRVPKSSNVKLIDFGSTKTHKEHRLCVVSTRHYRAPEVTLGLGWSYPCDMWSVGCILIELCSGELLFDTHEDIEHLAMMERVLGPIPPWLIQHSTREAAKYFRHNWELDWPEGASSSKSIRAVQRLRRLEDLVAKHAGDFAYLLTDLLRQLLNYNPRERLTAKQALNHSFF